MRRGISVAQGAIALLVLGMAVSVSESRGEEGKPYPNPARFEKAIARYEAQDKKTPPPAGAVVCIGSSSMGGWHRTIKKDLAPLTVIPRGFGGSNMNDALHYADRIVIPYRPRAVLVYEGDNDIACGVAPEQVRDAFAAFVAKVRRALPDVRIYVLSVKPSIRRWKKWPQMRAANGLIEAMCSQDKGLTYIDVASPMLDADGTPKKDIFRPDGLHMNGKGYAIWTETARPILVEREREFEKGM